jgi:hypothetical protein
MKSSAPPKRYKRLQAVTGLRRTSKPGKSGKGKASKRGPWRNSQYLAFVRSLPCCVCGGVTDSAHHIIGVGGMGGVGTKPGDEYTMPVCDGPEGCHGLIHRTPSMWPDQWEWVRRTQQAGLEAGFLSEVTV